MKNWRWLACGWPCCSITRWAKRPQLKSAAFQNYRQEMLIEKPLLTPSHSCRQPLALYARVHLRACLFVICGGCAAKEGRCEVRRTANRHEHHSTGGARINVAGVESRLA